MEHSLAPMAATFLPMLIILIIYFVIFAGIVILVVLAVRKSFRLREEQNDLLRQLVFNTRKEEIKK